MAQRTNQRIRKDYIMANAEQREVAFGPMRDVFETALRHGSTWDEAAGLALNYLANEAMRGNANVIVPNDADAELDRLKAEAAARGLSLAPEAAPVEDVAAE
jgi:hypothetical protein